MVTWQQGEAGGSQLAGKRVTVMGLGTRMGGLGVARYLAEQGAIVTVTDLKPATALTEPLRALDGLPIRFVLGYHDETDFTPAGADLIVRNPGVPRRAPLLQSARRHGLPVEMEMSLFFRVCPAPIIGITGTKGKTTTSTLCGMMLRAWRPDTILAGNMGISALGELARIGPETPVVLEISSWQLESLIEHGFAPRIAVLTNISQDHLNQYDGYEDYAATKRGITRHQGLDDVLILNAGNADTWKAAHEANARVIPFDLTDRGGDGAWLGADGELIWREHGVELRFTLPDTPALAGRHNAANALAAMAAALTRGATPAAIRAGLAAFAGVKDRMERVAEIAGVTYINDTTATAPAAAIAALETLSGRRVHLIAGGADKQTDLSALATLAATKAHAIYLLSGSATPHLQELMREAQAPVVGVFDSMSDAVAHAAAAAETDDVVLLSPGCASFGLFRDEFDRGERFRQAVARLHEQPAAVGGSGA